jgi:hypothetical protein
VPAVRTLEVDSTYKDGGYHFEAEALARDIASTGVVETFVSLNPWHSPSLDVLARSVGATCSVGIGEGPWTEAVAEDFECHSSELAFRAALALDGTLQIESFAYPPAYPTAAARFARQVRDEIIPGPLLVVHRDTKLEKQWHDSGWADVMLEWISKNPDGLLIDVGLTPIPNELPTALRDRILHGMNLPLDYVLALTGVSDLFVGVDSCFLHAADLARVPLLGLFFGTKPAEFGARWSHHRHLEAPNQVSLPADRVSSALASLWSEVVNGGSRVPGHATPTGTLSFYQRRNASVMATRKRFGLSLSSLGLGTSRFYFSRDLDIMDVVMRSLELGCNVIDIAGNHGGGEACAVLRWPLRRALACGLINREQLFLCGKAGFTEHLRDSATGKIRGWSRGDHCLTVDYLAWEFERQCHWMDVSRLDAFLLQNPEETLEAVSSETFWGLIKAAFGFFEKLIADGKLSFYGVSTAEAFRVERSNKRHIDLADLYCVADSVGGARHGFRVLELPVSVNHLEALDIPAHRALGGSVIGDLPVLIWAERESMIVLASASLNGGRRLDALAGAVADITGIDDSAANLLQIVRSLPGVTCALVGISSPIHLHSVHALLGVGFLDANAKSMSVASFGGV